MVGRYRIWLLFDQPSDQKDPTEANVKPVQETKDVKATTKEVKPKVIEEVKVAPSKKPIPPTPYNKAFLDSLKDQLDIKMGKFDVTSAKYKSKEIIENVRTTLNSIKKVKDLKSNMDSKYTRSWDDQIRTSVRECIEQGVVVYLTNNPQIEGELQKKLKELKKFKNANTFIDENLSYIIDLLLAPVNHGL